MKELSYLNKYLFKYKHYLVLGTIFIIISNAFGIIPAQLVRHSFDFIGENFRVFSMFEDSSTQDSIQSYFTSNILILAGAIILAAVALPAYQNYIATANMGKVNSLFEEAIKKSKRVILAADEVLTGPKKKEIYMPIDEFDDVAAGVGTATWFCHAGRS